MAFLSCEEMLAAARSQKISLAEAVLRSDLEESRLTEAHSRAAMRHLWQVMQATSQEYDPAQRSRSGLSGGDAAKVEQAWQQSLFQCSNTQSPNLPPSRKNQRALPAG